MKLPILNSASSGNTSRVVTDVFRGYNHNLKIADGEMFDMSGLTSENYPLLSRRKPRTLGPALTRPQGLLGGDSLVWMDNNGLYVDGTKVVQFPIPAGTVPEPQQLVRFGSYVLIYPIGYYHNLSDANDHGYIDATLTYTPSDPPLATEVIHYEPCNIDGVPYTNGGDPIPVGDTEPEEPVGGEYWMKVTATETVLVQYDAVTTTWVKVENVYMLVVFPTYDQIPAKFKAGDTVEISGLYYDDLNGRKHIYKVGGDYAHGVQDHLVLIGLDAAIETAYTSVSISRTTPTMDHIFECQNRLWGCRYDGTINEVYCSALGDFKNWRVYQGLSTDSWAASVGSPGPWTGGIGYLGKPVFFKEDRIFTVTISAQGAHSMDETPCRGVDPGSSRSLCVVGETLYYKSKTDVMAWQGGFPSSVSGSAFGEVNYDNGIGGSYGVKYYLLLREVMPNPNDAKHWVLFVYDTARGFWIKEQEWNLSSAWATPGWFTNKGLELYGIVPEVYGHTGETMIVGMTGTVKWTTYGYEGTTGTGNTQLFPWSMETGIQYYEYPDRKYVSRYDIRLWKSEAGDIDIYLEYDSSGTWISMGRVHVNNIGTATIPIRPRRCDHMRMKLEGTGDVKILSIARILEVGSDV